jgi:hypothetical protein
MGIHLRAQSPSKSCLANKTKLFTGPARPWTIITTFSIRPRRRRGSGKREFAAFLGVYATVGFVVGPTTLAALPVTGAVRDIILAAMCLAGFIAIGAIWSAYQASASVPKLQTASVLAGWELAFQSIDAGVESSGI